jgi:hypothetical protein
MVVRTTTTQTKTLQTKENTETNKTKQTNKLTPKENFQCRFL